MTCAGGRRLAISSGSSFPYFQYDLFSTVPSVAWVSGRKAAEGEKAHSDSLATHED